mmetsp:Transcript_15707/g.47345  ORF Transcript_15707/g.47345 Transcript_15707/m.47345 type:complete len:296 (-) Transcript_15707:589-1476(-)
MSKGPGASQRVQFVKEYGVSGVSVGIATMTTNPVDVVKVRLQLAKAGKLALPTGLRPDGMVQTAVAIVRTEGLLALWSGWQASLARSFFYGGARLGFYTPMKRLVGVDQNPSFAGNLVAGSASGGLAAVICNPTELVKVRLQSKDGARGGPGAVIRKVIAEDGFLGLWRGTVPAATRAAIMTASQLATYNEIKAQTRRLTGWGEGVHLHLAASMIAGLVSTTVTSPVDVVKTKMFVAGNQYTGPIHCFRDLIRREGLRGLFKGWVPNYCRLGPQTTITFVAVEKLRQLAGLDTLS